MKFGKLISTKRGVVFKSSNAKIEIGEDCFFNYGCGVFAHESIKIGKSCSFGPNVMIFDHDHNFRKINNGTPYITESIEIGNRTWVGANAVILRGAKIGQDCVIGAGTVVRGYVPDHSLVISSDSNIIKQIGSIK